MLEILLIKEEVRLGRKAEHLQRWEIEMTESEARLSLRNTGVVGITEVIQSLALEF
jgi:hypothetical protein